MENKMPVDSYKPSNIPPKYIDKKPLSILKNAFKGLSFFLHPHEKLTSRSANKERGRSMVEMLGVLAVIGVLSVGAFTGYRYGMNKTRANELVAEMSVRTVALIGQLSQNPDDVSMEMGNKTKHGYAIDSLLDEGSNRYFYIYVEDIPTGVCREILNLDWQAPVEIYVNEFTSIDGTDACGEGDTVPLIEFKFDKYMDVEEYEDNPEETETETPEEEGSCPSNEPLKDVNGACHACGESASVNVQGVTGNCAVCPNRILKGNSCALNCPVAKPLKDASGVCHACDEAENINVYGVTGNCAMACPSRALVANLYCSLACPADKPLQDYFGTCYACDEPDDVDIYTDPSLCAVCPDRKIGGRNNQKCVFSCPKETPLMDRNKTCYTCSEEILVDVMTVTGNCAACPNRVLGGTNRNYCVLSCSSAKPLQDPLGKCYACDERIDVTVGSIEENCAVCPNRTLNGMLCVFSTCPADKPLQEDYSGTCYACDEPGNISAVEEKCAVCPNRKVDRNGGCLLNCPANKPLQDGSGPCYACDEPNGVYVYGVGENCNVCPNRKLLSSDYCALSSCPADKPLQDASGICYACDEPNNLNVYHMTENCNVCPNRELKDNSCVLNKN